MSERSGWQANREKKPLEWSRDERSWNRLSNGALAISRRAANATARAAAKRIREELDSLLSQELGKYASEDTSLVDLVRLPAERGQSEVISIGRI